MSVDVQTRSRRRGAEATTLASPLEYPPARPRPLVVAVTALLLGGVLAAVTRPWIGLAVGVAAAAVLWVPRTRGLLTAAAVGLMVAAGTVVVVDQATAPAQAGGTWPPTFSTAALLAWGAVACLVADATWSSRRAAQLGADRARRPHGATPAEDPQRRRCTWAGRLRRVHHPIRSFSLRIGRSKST